jgi:DNA polymerase elongation subunit (family B)
VDTYEPTGVGADDGPVRIYGLDIETDTMIDGLDPAVSPVVLAALSGPDGDEVFGGDEGDLLAALDARLRDLPPGILATWNGAAFDLPFVADRAGAAGVALGLVLAPDPTVVLSRGPLRGHTGAYRASWHAHRHIDAYRMYRSDVGRVLRISCSLKAIARVVGMTPVEVDRERIHELPRDLLDAYVASDARLARLLTERRRASFAAFVDFPILSRPTDVSRPHTLTVIPRQ